MKARTLLRTVLKVSGKGVCCHIAEPHEMPVDADGNRADMVMDPNSTVSRMNFGRFYEVFFNASARDLTREIMRTLSIPFNYEAEKKYEIMLNSVELKSLLTKLDTERDPNFEQAWNRLLGFYEIVSPKTYEWFVSGAYTKTRHHHMLEILQNGIYIYHPPETDHEVVDAVKQLQRNYPSTYGPLSYIGYSGNRSITYAPGRIGSLYVMLLEKTGDDWAAVSSGKWQNFGVLAQITNQDKYAQATRNQAVRALGETEVRIVASCMGPLTAAELIDRNNNTLTHRQVVDAILTADKPSYIECAVDRSVNPLGNARPLQLVKHLALCGGWEFAYKPHIPASVPPEIYAQLGKKLEKGNA